jgi:tetratricopeptide (TPR) repeat protein
MDEAFNFIRTIKSPPKQQLPQIAGYETTHEIDEDIPENDDATEDFRMMTDLGWSYLENGDLKNADISYERCENMINKLLPENSIQRILIRMQRAITTLQRGNYGHARDILEDLKQRLPGVHTENEGIKVRVYNQLCWWLAVSLLRQGEYVLAQNEVAAVWLGIEGDLGKSKTALNKLPNESILRIIATRRLLALIYGLSGLYNDAIDHITEVSTSIAAINKDIIMPKGSDEQKLVEPQQEAHLTENSLIQYSSTSPATDWVSCQNNFEFTQGVVLGLYGKYSEALEKAKSALEGRVKRWGQRHFRSLEASNLVALLLALNSAIDEAEHLCKKNLKTMTEVLGNMHPMTMEAMSTLIYVFRGQGRFIEAVDTSQSLCKMMETSLGVAHPQTLGVKCQQAAAHAACGSYLEAEKILETIWELSKTRLGEDHPDTLRFGTELARVWALSWNYHRAKDLVREVIRDQQQVFAIGIRKSVPKHNPGSIARTSASLDIDGLLEDILNDTESLRVHPELLVSLQVLAKIESKMPTPNFKFAEKILTIIWGATSKRLGKEHALTLSVEFDLASTYRDMKELELAADMFNRVASVRKLRLGETHPETLAARHECMIMDFTFGKLVPDDDIVVILNLREGQLGRNHPDTLHSLMWAFAIRLVQNHDTASSTAKDLLERLNNDCVRTQRLVESLRTEERIALVYIGQEQFDEGEKVLLGTQSTIDSLNEELQAQLAVIEVRRRVRRHIEQTLPSARKVRYGLAVRNAI